MTLIIAKDGKLHADRRVVRGVGDYRGMTAHNRGDKIVKLPFGAYAISGAEPHDEESRKELHETIRMAMCVYEFSTWIQKNFNKITASSGSTYDDCLKADLLEAGYFAWTKDICTSAIGTLAKQRDIHILAIHRDCTFWATPNYCRNYAETVPIAVGSGETVARYFLADNYDIADVYRIVGRQSGFHITQAFDTFDLADLPDLIPDICNWEIWFRAGYHTALTAFGPLAKHYMDKDSRPDHVAGVWTPEEADNWSRRYFTLYRIIASHIKFSKELKDGNIVEPLLRPRRWFGKDGKINPERGHKTTIPGMWSFVRNGIYTEEHKKEDLAALKQKETENKKS